MNPLTRIGIDYTPDFMPEHLDVFARVRDQTAWDTRMRARFTASFGRPYNYSGMVYPQTAIPEIIELARARVEQRLDYQPNNCLVNYYQDGRSTMGLHADSTAELVVGTGVAVVSLGSTRTMVFRNIAERRHECRLALLGGSLLYLPPAVHQHWLHGIPRQAGAGPRISLTFRALADPNSLGTS